MRTDSPEDRLLRLIKGKYNKQKDAAKTPARPASNTESFLTDVSKKVFMKNKAVKSLFSNTVNKILAVILIALGAYLAFNLLFPFQRSIDYLVTGENAVTPENDIRKEASDVPLAPYVEDYSAYSRAMRGKDLFAAPSGEGREALAAAVPAVDISKRFNLVGIITGDEPQAIIEDKEAKKTHYLYEGQSINGVSVLEIADGRVILDYNGQEIMLVL